MLRVTLNASLVASGRTMAVTGRVDADVRTDLDKLPRTVSSPKAIPYFVLVEVTCVEIVHCFVLFDP